MNIKKISLITLLAISTTATSHAQVGFQFPNSLNLNVLKQGMFGDPVGTDKDGKPIYKDSAQVPSGPEGYAHSMGTGPIDRTSLPVIPSITQDSSSVMRAGLGYSCGQFDPFANVKQVIEQAKQKFKKMPQYFVTSAQESVAALPAYILNTINPTLYNTITKNFDDAFALFDMNYKSCAQIESQMSNNAGTYFDFINTAKMQRQLKEIVLAGTSGTVTLDEVQEKVAKEDGSGGVQVAGGKLFGGKGQDNLDLAEQIVIAGYNMLISRKDTTDTSKPSQGLGKDVPMVNAFPTPEDAFIWIRNLYGTSQLKYVDSKESGSSSLSNAGVGFRYLLTARRAVIHAELNKLVNKQITPTQFYENTDVVIPPIEVEDLRSMQSYPLSQALSARANIEAKRDMQQRLRYIRQIVESGAKEPNLSQSLVSNNAKEKHLELIMYIERDLNELNILMNEG